MQSQAQARQGCTTSEAMIELDKKCPRRAKENYKKFFCCGAFPQAAVRASMPTSSNFFVAQRSVQLLWTPLAEREKIFKKFITDLWLARNRKIPKNVITRCDHNRNR
jgi:hypothetical protein